MDDRDFKSQILPQQETEPLECEIVLAQENVP